MQKTLQLGVNMSPKSLPRQRKLGDVALKNDDTATAEKAYEKIVREKYSYAFRPADMATLARSYLKRGDTKATKHLVENQKKFLNATDEGKVIVSVAMAEVCSKTGDTVNAKRHIQEAIRVKGT